MKKYQNENQVMYHILGWVYFSSSVELPTAMLTNYNNYNSVAEKNVGVNNLKGEIL